MLHRHNTASLVRALKSSKLYILGSKIKEAVVNSRQGLSQEVTNRAVVSLAPERSPKGYVLLSHQIRGFLLPPGQPIPMEHHN